MDALLGAVSELCLAHKIPKERLIGIGVSCPGPLDYKNGIVHNPPGLSLFHHFKVREYLSEKTALPVYLDNNSVLLGMYEKRLRKNSLHSWIFIVISGGVGSAVFSDGRLFRGSGAPARWQAPRAGGRPRVHPLPRAHKARPTRSNPRQWR